MVSNTHYIKHHLTYLTYNLKTMSLGTGGGFWTLNLDTIFFSIVLGMAALLLMYIGARRVTTGVPGKLQNLLKQCWCLPTVRFKDCFHGKNNVIGPLALTIFMWVS